MKYESWYEPFLGHLIQELFEKDVGHLQEQFLGARFNKCFSSKLKHALRETFAQVNCSQFSDYDRF